MIIRDESGRQKAFSKIEALNLDKAWEIEIEPYNKNRTEAQNKLLWKWLTIWGQDLGYTKDEMYDVVVDQYWPIHDEELSISGRKVSRQRRTSKLKTKPFSEFLNTIDIEASKTGTVLPHPEDLYFAAMLK